jgi:16S rRNA (guanine527-N7)-methyltransferase
VLSDTLISSLLQPFGVALSATQFAQVRTYLEILLRWNLKINLTAIRSPEECMTRHFGESFYLASLTHVRGHLLDVGSGAGFPGLALKILSPDLAATLLEPVAKKRAFLKEAARACNMADVAVTGQRLEEYVSQGLHPLFDLFTARAVGDLGKLVPSATRCLRPGGRICLWLGAGQEAEVRSAAPEIRWEAPHPIPLSQQRIILIGAST